MPETSRVAALIIPALNEEQSLAELLREVPPLEALRAIVVDNGSTDRTAEVAASLGARVVREPRRGYGSACLAGAEAAVAQEAGVLIFMDADRSHDPREIPRLLSPLAAGEADVVIGSRSLAGRQKGALLPHARFGNALVLLLIRLLFGRRFSDLGPFRAFTAEAWRRLSLDDRGYGLTVQGQVRSLALGLRVLEVPVSCRRRQGRSKISGTLRGTVGAGRGMLAALFREYLKASAAP